MRFDYQPILRSDLIELRPLCAEDYDELRAVAADPLLWTQHPVKTRHEEASFREFFSEALDSGGTLIAIDSRTGRVIGSSRFHGHDSDRSEVEIGWTFLARSHWGGLYNGELKQLMLRHAFRFVRTVVLLVGPENLRSQRAVEKIGGVRAGQRTDAGGRDSYLFRVTHSEFEPKVVDAVRPEGGDEEREPMSVDYSLERDGNITTIRIHRRLTLDEVLSLVDEVARSDITNRRLWDLTDNFDFTSDEIAQIAARGRAHWPSAARVAYVAANSLSFGLLRMFEVFREQQNYETRVFREEQSARDWLREWAE